MAQVIPAGFVAADENVHPADPGEWSWSESWFLSFVDLDDGPAGTFRVGITPNQNRAMLWFFVAIDGAWYTFEESRLNYSDFDLSADVSYDKWGLRFASHSHDPFDTGSFTFSGVALVRSGPKAGARVPMSVELDYVSAAPMHGTGIGSDEDLTKYGTGRFEQSLTATGTVTVGGEVHQIRAGAHRDKSWGPREWTKNFAMGDLQGEGRQLYFVGDQWPGRAMGYVREGSDNLDFLQVVDAHIEFADETRSIKSADLSFKKPDGTLLSAALIPVTDSINFDIAHAAEPPEHWLYWRTLVQGNVSGWDEPVRGWFEASRFGVA
ncbi:hypothetical protein [Nocardia sp. 348MFTsu5.1]|uniref:DUF7065 domain-containing protein n=1 Tax=Nocardia sp. 348MFTsu5.1 TaxID=1172185 RepID=UPI000382923B|nr:hypothetical protein [Nocardia sp. 348MFTsu5.1]